jgi:hypothetical protein
MARLALTQILKRCPINFRSALLVPKTQNPKGLALFLMSAIKLARLGLLEDKDLIRYLIGRLEVLRSAETPYACWGYSFPWQTRTTLVPDGYPNLVCTVFVASALLEAYRHTGSRQCLELGSGAAEYLLNSLYWTEGPSSAGFSYPTPWIRTHIYNADFLGAMLLCRVYRTTGERRLLEPALRTARCAVLRQGVDGAWPYGELPEQQWVDNFHTGFNLSALMDLNSCGEPGEFTPYLNRGFAFYRRSFLREGEPPKYFHNRTYPIDIHCLAQSILTLIDFRGGDESNIGRALDLFQWASAHMRSRAGYFYYRLHPFYKNRISYMRWSQAWMLLALSSLLEATSTDCDQARISFRQVNASAKSDGAFDSIPRSLSVARKVSSVNH